MNWIQSFEGVIIEKVHKKARGKTHGQKSHTQSETATPEAGVLVICAILPERHHIAPFAVRFTLRLVQNKQISRIRTLTNLIASRYLARFELSAHCV